METAWNVLNEMLSNGVVGNVRTLNTLLRGCLLHGDTSKAFDLFIQMSTAGKYFEELMKEEGSNDEGVGKKKTKHEGEQITHGGLSKQIKINDNKRCDADASSYEYLVCLLSHSLRMKDAAVIAKLRFHKHPSSTNQGYQGGGGKNQGKQSSSSSLNGLSCDMIEEEDDGFIDLHLARGYAMLSNWKQCNKHLYLVERIIERVKLQDNGYKNGGQSEVVGDGMQRESGGRRSKKSSIAATDKSGEGRDHSNKNFRSHRHEVSSVCL